MSLDPRIIELLERYPDQLSDEELAELRAAGEADPEIETLMDSIHETEALLAGASSDVRMSEGGREKLGAIIQDAKAWSTGGATPSGSAGGESEVTAWSTGGATPSGRAQSDGPRAWSTGGATPSGKVVDLGAERQRRGFFRANPAAAALAAGLLVAAGFMVSDQLGPEGPGYTDPYTLKGDDDSADPERIEGELYVMGEQRIEDGGLRPVDSPVTFRAVMEEPAALVLLETQGGATFVLHPPPGEAWLVEAGSNLLLPEETSAEYKPGSAGEATYTLIASPPRSPIPIPPDRKVRSPGSLLRAQEATYMLDSLRIVWEETLRE